MFLSLLLPVTGLLFLSQMRFTIKSYISLECFLSIGSLRQLTIYFLRDRRSTEPSK